MKTKNQTGLKNFKPKKNLNHNISITTIESHYRELHLHVTVTTCRLLLKLTGAHTIQVNHFQVCRLH